MAELIDTLQKIAKNERENSAPVEFLVGTVTNTEPLEITTKTTMLPLKENVLILTEPVIEKKIPITDHTHTITDTYTGGGSASTELTNIVCYENGKALPRRDGYIILNRGLEVGDIVLMLRVLGGQNFIVLSRSFASQD